MPASIILNTFNKVVTVLTQAFTAAEQQIAQKNLGFGQRRDLYSFGAKGDYDITSETGTDDSAAIQAALDWWYANPGVTLEIGPGVYGCYNPVRLIANQNRLYLGNIVGLGGIIQSRISSIAGTGTVVISGTGTVLTGTGTAFTTQCKVGDQVEVNGSVYTIRAITSDTAATLISDAGITGDQVSSSYVIWPPTIQFYSQASNRRPEFTGLRFRGHASVTGGITLNITGDNGGASTWETQLRF